MIDIGRSAEWQTLFTWSGFAQGRISNEKKVNVKMSKVHYNWETLKNIDRKSLSMQLCRMQSYCMDFRNYVILEQKRGPDVCRKRTIQHSLKRAIVFGPIWTSVQVLCGYGSQLRTAFSRAYDTSGGGEIFGFGIKSFLSDFSM